MRASCLRSQEGEALSPERLTQLVREYVLSAETGKSGSCHLFRYTQVSIRKLKTVHALTHPSAKIDRPTRSTAAPGGGRERCEGPALRRGGHDAAARPASSRGARRGGRGRRAAECGTAELCEGAAELMASLADEHEEG